MSKSISESLDNINIIFETKCHDAGGELHFDPEHLGIFREETASLGERLGLSPFQLSNSRKGAAAFGRWGRHSA